MLVVNWPWIRSNKKSLKNRYKILSEEENDKIKEYQRKRYQYKKEILQNKWVLFLLRIEMTEKGLKFDNIMVNKK